VPGPARSGGETVAVAAAAVDEVGEPGAVAVATLDLDGVRAVWPAVLEAVQEIGRASCRERV